MELAKPVIKLKDVLIRQHDYIVLNNVDLEVRTGEFIYLVGKTGSGKSSLLKTLYGELPIDYGSIQVVDFDLSKMSWKKLPFLRRKLGIIFQDFHLLMDRNVEENLYFVLEATDWKDAQKMQERVDKTLSKVGLEDKSKKMPYELSGGEQQRLVIARALVNGPQVVLADEPTGNLDPETADEIVKLLRSISHKYGTTVLMATHNYNIIERFPARIVRCQDGRIFDEKNISL